MGWRPFIIGLVLGLGILFAMPPIVILLVRWGDWLSRVL